MILPDRLAPGLRVVFCGTAAGTVSARKGTTMPGRATGSGPCWPKPG
ncbi:hypothetical protein ACFSHQ_15820 [Gemmobacter lanyuensis]